MVSSTRHVDPSNTKMAELRARAAFPLQLASSDEGAGNGITGHEKTGYTISSYLRKLSDLEVENVARVSPMDWRIYSGIADCGTLEASRG
jgi:hypothetical protein